MGHRLAVGTVEAAEPPFIGVTTPTLMTGDCAELSKSYVRVMHSEPVEDAVDDVVAYPDARTGDDRLAEPPAKEAL